MGAWGAGSHSLVEGIPSSTLVPVACLHALGQALGQALVAGITRSVRAFRQHTDWTSRLRASKQGGSRSRRCAQETAALAAPPRRQLMRALARPAAPTR